MSIHKIQKKKKNDLVLICHFSYLTKKCQYYPLSGFGRPFVAMKYIAAYLLAQAGGKSEPTAADVKAILESVGAAVDEKKLEDIIAKFQGKNIDELIEEGQKKMIVVGGAAAAPAAGGAAAAAPAEEAKEEAKEEEASAPLALDDMFGDW